MQLLVDEGIHRGVVVRLRDAGHQVSYIAELSPGSPDADVLDRANRNDEILVTEDKDFGELVFRQNLTNRGVILLRMYGLSASDQAAALLDFLANHGERAADAFSVITMTSFRIRHQNY
jgi:predicted nuclease of predicted toxin-antitoxin system